MARFAIHTAVGRGVPTAFPFGTLAVNVIGCFAIGYLATALSATLPVREELRLALLVGVLGGFTTFSTFGWETLRLLQTGSWALALVNVVASSTLALLAVWAGHRLATG